jgi:hypothetical protein
MINDGKVEVGGYQDRCSQLVRNIMEEMLVSNQEVPHCYILLN